MSKNTNRLDENGELNIVVHYYPDEPAGESGGNSGSGASSISVEAQGHGKRKPRSQRSPTPGGCTMTGNGGEP